MSATFWVVFVRLLQVSPEEARRVICAPKEVVDEFQEEANLLGFRV